MVLDAATLTNSIIRSVVGWGIADGAIAIWPGPGNTSGPPQMKARPPAVTASVSTFVLMTLNRTLLLGMTTTLTVKENITKDTVQYSAAVHMCDFSAVNVRKQTWEN